MNESSTWQDQGIYALGDEINLPDYVDNYDNGDYGFDTLGIGEPSSGGVTLDNQVVAVLATKDFYLGNLGVTSRPTNFSQLNDPHTSFLSSLKEQSHIPSLTYGYSACNNYRKPYNIHLQGTSPNTNRSAESAWKSHIGWLR